MNRKWLIVSAMAGVALVTGGWLLQRDSSPQGSVYQQARFRLFEEQMEREGFAVSLLDFSLERMANWVLSFGSTAEVISPEGLKELVAAEAGKVVAQYALPRPPASLNGNTVARKPVRSAVRISKVS